ncbi:Ig-like domain-containing protein [Qipengyuania marisflavi]|uniref:Cadherin domain-containing protein n=1 Tax=Qipengyuania marisflavi TaxID=2486356 RepID=A0A5S3PA59_9SPHN|nr:Ig-like domain-containing protein [Qipengyuania marisflavi]TMM50399.1 hypothetical protein FEV51_04295 [Qipengyuania marisflavi]
MSNIYHSLESGNFFEDWSDTSRLSRFHDWSQVASIMGYRGASLTGRADVDARSVTGFSDDLYSATGQSDPNSYNRAGIAEFELDNPVVALGGAGSTRAPSLVLYMDATGREDITLSFTARDLETGSHNSVQQLNVQYRIGDSGIWTNVPGGYIADASADNATMETHVSVTLPDEASGHADLQIRIMTVDASGYDEWIGIDDISVTSIRDADYVPPVVQIYDIQGEGHLSAFEGHFVATTGIVTAIDRSGNGFYLQAAQGDGNAATSDAIYVRNEAGVRVAIGDALTVTGVVHEDVRGSGLTITQLAAETLSIESRGNALPEAVRIGGNGLNPPTSVIDNDGMTSYDPQTDGLDFWESLEGMRVTMVAPQAVSNTNSYGETYLVAARGNGATGMNDRGGITISEGDWNPEMIQLDDNLVRQPGMTIGDQLGNLTGVIGYGFDHYELQATQRARIVQDVTLQRETTDLVGDANHMTVATYDLENIDPGDGDRFAQLSHDIVANLRAPDVIAVQRLQDADGTGTGSDLSGEATAQALIDAIYEESGIRYTYVEIAPNSRDSTAGEEHGNIRNGYLYRADRVSLVEGSLVQIDNAIFEGTRSPLVATWEFNGHEVTTVNVHFTSRVGSDALWGDVQAPYHAGTIMRTNQIAAVQEYVTDLLAHNPAANVMLAGNWNGYMFERAQTQLTDTGLFANLALELDAAERYSTIVDGNAQLVDNILVSNGLLDLVDFDIVHINSEFAGQPRGSNHDPLVSSIFLDHAPENLLLNGGSVEENLRPGAVAGQLVVDDTAGETLRYVLLDDAGGRFVVDAASGLVTTTRALNYEANNSYTLTARVTDSTGLSTDATVVVRVRDVNEAPVAASDTIDVAEDAQTANLWSYVLANDSDPDAGSRLSISEVDLSGTLGTVEFDAVTATLRYTADADVFDTLKPGEVLADSFAYTVTDEHGLTHTATVTIVITGEADGVVLYGGNGKDLLLGTGGEDRLYGGNGSDTLIGFAGHDWLQGDRGNDILTGGAGRDSFAVGKATAHDTVTDFSTADDRIVMLDGVSATSSRVLDADGDGNLDLRIFFSDGSGTVTLLGVSNFADVHIDSANGPGAHGGYWMAPAADMHSAMPLDLANTGMFLP